MNFFSKSTMVDYRSIIPIDKLLPEEIHFIDNVLLPNIKRHNFNSSEQETILQRYKTIVVNREKYPSRFPKNKEYDRELVKVEGVKKVGDITEMSRSLVLGLISRKPQTIEQSFEWFQKDFVLGIRPHITPERIFSQVRTYLQQPLTEDGAKEMLDKLVDKNYTNHGGLGRIVEYLKSLSNSKNSKNVSEATSLVTRLNDRTIDLSISFGKYGCCAFWGIVEQDQNYQKDLNSRYHGSLLYLADPEIGLLFHHLEKDGKRDIPTGVVILADMIGKKFGNSQNEERYLLVDSVEAYRPGYDSRFPDNPLRQMDNDIWRRLTYQSLFGVAKDIGATKIFYNMDFWNEGGNTFTNYLENRLKRENVEFENNARVSMRKENGRKVIPDEYNDKFGFFLDALIPKDSAHFHNVHAIKGSYDGSGESVGTLISIC